jgi:peptide/nickel transport system substrate-binding protein
MIKNKRTFMVFAMLVAGCLLCTTLVSAGGQSEAATPAAPKSKYGGRFIYGFNAEPPTLDWHFTTSNATRTVSIYIWEGLVEFDANDEIQPNLAESYSVSADKLTWTFKLRRGIKFHNGKEMTSDDVVASIKRWMQVSPRRGPLGPVKSVDAVDAYTVQIKLDSPLGALPAIMALPSGHLVIMPKETIEGVAGGRLTQYIGTGPYEFVEWKANSHILLKRYANYSPLDSAPGAYSGRKEAYLDEIMVRFVPEISTLLAGLETGEFHLIEPLEPRELPRLQQNKNIELQRYLKWQLTTLFNTKVPPFNDVRLRQAALMALDMEEIMLSVGKDKANIELDPWHYAQGSAWYSNAGLPYYNLKDKAGARKLMQEAGYNGQPIRFMTTTHYPWAYDMAIPMVAQLTAIGFNIKMEVMDWPTLVSRRAKVEEWEMFTTAGGISQDPIMLSQTYDGTYPGWYSSPVATEALKVIARVEDFNQRFKAMEDMVVTGMKEAQSVRPGNLFEYRAYRSNVKGLPKYHEALLFNVYLE